MEFWLGFSAGFCVAVVIAVALIAWRANVAEDRMLAQTHDSDLDP